MSLSVRKTDKLYSNGAFIRSESGRVTSEAWGQVPVASRKDARDAVRAGVGGCGKLASLGYNGRGLVVYRIGEMLDAQRERFVSWVGEDEFERGVNALVSAAGWSDKINSVLGEVSSPAAGLSASSSMCGVGVVAMIGVAGFVETLAGIGSSLAGGNAVICVLPAGCGEWGLALGEVLGVSDVPAGAVALLTGYDSEVARTLCGATGVRGVRMGQNLDEDAREELAGLVAGNLARLGWESGVLENGTLSVEAFRWQVNGQAVVVATGW